MKTCSANVAINRETKDKLNPLYTLSKMINIFHDKVVVVVVVVVLFYISFVPAACLVGYLYSGSNLFFIRLRHSKLC